MTARLPVYITLPELARVLGMNRRRTLRFAQREKLLFKVGDGRTGRWVTTRERIAAAFPDVWDRIVSDDEVSQ